MLENLHHSHWKHRWYWSHWFNTPASTYIGSYCIPNDSLGSVFYCHVHLSIDAEPEVFHLLIHQEGLSSQHWLVYSWAEIGTACLLILLLGTPASQILLRPNGQDHITPASLPLLTRPGMGTWISRANYILSRQFGFCSAMCTEKARPSDAQREKRMKKYVGKSSEWPCGPEKRKTLMSSCFVLQWIS